MGRTFLAVVYLYVAAAPWMTNTLALAPPSKITPLAPPPPITPPITTTTTTTTTNELENRVIESIRSIASSFPNPSQTLTAFTKFTSSSTELIQTWLTPETLESCACFWEDGTRALARDTSRFWRGKPEDALALGWFVLISSGTFPFTPLLLPLIDAALEDVEEGVYVPRAFGGVRRGAVRRLRRGEDRPLPLDTPRNVDDGLRFFGDGSFLLARDLQRGQLLLRDSWQSYVWFSLLSFSTFPITPLLLPLIDKRRGEGSSPSDYVPSAYRSDRLRALQRARAIGTTRFSDAVDTLRAVADEPTNRPPPVRILEALVEAQRTRPDASQFLNALGGVDGDEKGCRWELAYVAGKPAVLDARRRRGVEPWYRSLERVILPWTRLRDGIYVDSYVSAIQQFDVETMENTNGVFQILGSDVFETTVNGPFSWSRGSICAFRPTLATFKLGSLRFDQVIPEDVPFEDVPMRELPFFKFVLIDDAVAVAMGRSGSVAIWTRMSE